MTPAPTPQDTHREVLPEDATTDQPHRTGPGGLLRFGVFVLLAIGLASACCIGLDQPESNVKSLAPGFEPDRARAILKKKQPNWVLVSNSMLATRLKAETLSRHSGQRASIIWWQGSRSAFWFLVMKRLIAEAPVKPEIVSGFFRCTDLTWADQKVSAQQEVAIATLEGQQQPEWKQVLGMAEEQEVASGRGRVKTVLDRLFPSANLSQWSRLSVQNKALRATRFGSRMTTTQRRAELNERFSLAHLRHDLGHDVVPEEGQPASPGNGSDKAGDGAMGLDDLPEAYQDGPRHFDPSPDVSFLPHMVALAAKEGFLLHFHRVKQRPEADSIWRDAPGLQRYLTSLRHYLAQNGCLYTDESDDPTLTLGMYADGDHLSQDPAVQQRYLANFWQRVAPLLSPHLPPR